jgi:hypothetical protein
MARKVRRSRVKAAERDLEKLSPRARARAIGKARATGRVFPTSGQRARARRRSR